MITDDHPSQKSYFPAMWALIAWGDFAIPSIIEILETEDPDSLKWKNGISVIRNYFRFDDSKAAEFLLSKADFAKSVKGTNRLRKAAQLILAEKEKLEKSRMKESKSIQ